MLVGPLFLAKGGGSCPVSARRNTTTANQTMGTSPWVPLTQASASGLTAPEFLRWPQEGQSCNTAWTGPSEARGKNPRCRLVSDTTQML